jgi:polyribonucleotide nucleotidyltransferase
MNSVRIPFGRHELIIETGKVARQADGAAYVQYGGTVVLTTVVAAKEPREGIDFFPLTVDYREKTYAAGKIPGGYFKREGRPTEREILVSRLIDRPIRPLFPDNFFNEVQIMSTVMSVDGENNPDILAVIGASAALSISSIPFEGPIGAVRIGLVDGQFIVNPTNAECETSDLNLVLVGTREKVVMIESGAHEVSEEQMLQAVDKALVELQTSIRLQDDLMRQCAKPKSAAPEAGQPNAITQKVEAFSKDRFNAVFQLSSKEEREAATQKILKDLLATFDPNAEDYDERAVKSAFHEFEKTVVRDLILNKRQRPDGRSFRDLRKISCEVSVLPRTHGSALFTRGQTQSLAVTTLGTSADEQIIDALEGELFKRFMLHYNFPPFSVGEVGRNTGPGRREIGHGALAEKALLPVMPSEEEFPYTVRMVSDILESNGSSSMATVCGGTLSLMDAGVPLRAPVAGIALGLVTDTSGRYEILTDIAGIEDHLGDMDFKVAGTTKGITALQLDIKIKGISTEIIRKAIEQAHEARLKILDIMAEVIREPRAELSQYAPRITVLQVNPNKIKDLIGPGGKVIKKIIEETGVKIDIEDDGKVFVASSDAQASAAAIAKIRSIAEEAEIGKVYMGKVRKIMNFGAFCEILPGTDGLVHISEIADGYVKKVEDHLKLGDVVPVKVVGIDEEGRINLSIKKAKQAAETPG